VDHDQHHCDARLCSFPCQLCKRLCANTDHLHGLQDDAIHLCGFVNRSSTPLVSKCQYREEHSCPKPCTADGICEIETAPQSIEATFTGRHETFQYTKVAFRFFVDIVFQANTLLLSIVLTRFVREQLTLRISTHPLPAKQLPND
jgi:hypothetical protein